MEADIQSFFKCETDYPVCISNGVHINYLSLKNNIAGLYCILKEMPQQRVVLAVNDTVNFIRGFMALVLSGKEIILPANNQPATITTGIQDAQAMIVDFDCQSELPVIKLDEFIDADKQDSMPDLPLIPESITIEICTSGTTGEPKQIRKSLGTFIDELKCLEQQWGTAVDGKYIISTVTHLHIYGLLFRVLWPLLTKRLFLADNIEYPEQIIKIAVQQGDLVLISSPAYLKRMIDVLDSSQLDNHIRLIFSSGGPLASDVAFTYQQKLGLLPTEVLGSTETGGIAYRKQDSGDKSLWHKFPVVRLRTNDQNGALEVQSPFCFTHDWYTMGDRVEIVNENQFRLVGRLDRIVKLEEKRISLDNMEKILEQSPDIQRAKVVDIPGKRTILGVVAVLSEQGTRRLQQSDRKDFAKHIKQYLSQYFERVTLPRKWRYVTEFPYNSQGKLTRQALLDLFDGEQ